MKRDGWSPERWFPKGVRGTERRWTIPGTRLRPALLGGARRHADRGRRWLARGVLAALALAGGIGCGREPLQGVGLPGEVIDLSIQGKVLSVEVSSDATSRHVGLMNRKSLRADSGMLFIFPAADRLSFWMKNTVVPLSIAFVDDQGTILQIEDMKPLDEASIRADHRIRYAVEVNQGWFQRNGVKVGDAFADFQDKVRRFRGS